MSSTARPMVGTTFTWNNASIGEIKNLTFAGFTKPTANVSHFQDTWADKIATGVVDAGSISFDLNFNADTWELADALMTDFVAGTARTCVVTYAAISPANAWTASFTGIISGYTPGSGGLEDAASASLTIEITGAVTVAGAAD